MSKKVLEIRLKSDVCMGSGYAYAGIIDMDTCYDDNGIPYIPGKRLKGCLREAAEYVCDEEQIKEIFGERDNDGVKGLMISNAYIPNAEIIKKELNNLKLADSEYREFVTQQNILKLFTSVKAQTSINEDTGVAEPTSLRFTRVVNHYSCFDNQEMVFEAKIEYENIDDEIIEKIAKSLRHIGMSRNRGLGNVRCSIRDNKAETSEINILKQMNADDETVELKYIFTNEQPLMLSANNDNKSESYINGQSILGALAGAYLRNGGNAEKEEFKEIFLRGKVKFHNAYITDEKNNEYIPVPLYLRKLKKSKKVVNILLENIRENEELDEEYVTDNGNQPKQIKNTYVNISNYKNVIFSRTNESIIYHHTRQSKNNDEKLYSFKVLKENQRFSGKIECPAKNAKILSKLLNNMTLRLGKSKTAQYGCCKIEKIETCNKLNQGVKVDGTIAVTLESDGIFIHNNTYTNRCDDVRNSIINQLGLKVQNDESRTYMNTRIITGYNTKWNMKKPSLPAVEAGSTFVFKLTEPTEISSLMIGERNLEGYGRIRIDKLDDMSYKVDGQKLNISGHTSEIGNVKEILIKLMTNELLDMLKLNAISINKMKLTASTIGRLTLMLVESNMDYNDFYARVCSIKREGERNGIINFLLKHMFDCKDEQSVVINMNKITRNMSEANNVYQKLQRLIDQKEKERIDSIVWHTYLNTILVHQKYMLAGGEKNEEGIL